MKTGLIAIWILLQSLTLIGASASISGPLTPSAMNNNSYTCSVSGLQNDETVVSYTWNVDFIGQQGSLNGSNFGISEVQSSSTSNTATIKWDGVNGATSDLIACDVELSSGLIVTALLNVNVKGIGNIFITKSGEAWKCNTSSVTYSVQGQQDGNIFAWTVPPGWSITTGALTNSIVVTPDATTAGNVTCTVRLSSSPASYFKTATLAITRPVQPPTFLPTNTLFCLPTSNSAAFGVSPVTGASSYIWSAPPGWILFSKNGVLNGPNISVNFNSTPQTGQICCTTISACGGQSTSTCISVTVTTNPIFAVDITPHPGHCDYNLKTFNYTPAITNYIWKYKKTNQTIYTTQTSTINQCLACFLQPSTSYDYIVTLINGCGGLTTKTGQVSTPPPCSMRIGEFDESNTTPTVDQQEIKNYLYKKGDHLFALSIYNPELTDIVNVSLFDTKGALVKNLALNKSLPSGENELEFSTDEIPPGIYYCRLTGSRLQEVFKFVNN